MAVLVESYRAVFFQGTFPELGPLLLAAATSAWSAPLGVLGLPARRHDLVDAM